MKCAIFDLDGTLINSLNTISYYANLALKEHGFSEIPVEKYRFLVGKGAKRLISDALSELGSEDEILYEKVYNRYMELYINNPLYLSEIYDGIKELLLKLKQNNIKLAILSNKPDEQVQPIVSRMFEKNLFHMVCGQTEEFPRKPDPSGALNISEILGVSPDECIYFGDTSTDMKTGKNAGFYTVGVTWGFRSREELVENKADMVIDSPKEIYNFLKI